MSAPKRAPSDSRRTNQPSISAGTQATHPWLQGAVGCIVKTVQYYPAGTVEIRKNAVPCQGTKKTRGKKREKKVAVETVLSRLPSPGLWNPHPARHTRPPHKAPISESI